MPACVGRAPAPPAWAPYRAQTDAARRAVDPVAVYELEHD